MGEEEATATRRSSSAVVMPGNVVLEAAPFVAVLVGDAADTHCHGCFRPMEDVVGDSGGEGGGGITCGRCNLPRYCSPACVDSDARTHTRECAAMAAAPEQVRRSNMVRMLARLLLKLADKSGGEKEAGEEVPRGRGGKSRRTFWDLMSHESEFSSSERLFKTITGLHWTMTNFLGPSVVGSLDAFVGVYGRLMINSFEVSGDQRQVAKAWGLYLAASVIDHSCVPTASVSFRGKNIVIRTLIPLPDEEDLDLARDVTISYIDLMEHTDIRRKELLRRYYFVCQCPRCLGAKLPWQQNYDDFIDEDEMNPFLDCDTESIFLSCYGPLLSGRQPLTYAEDLMYSIRCQNCTGRPVFLGRPSDLEEEARCPKCGEAVGEATLDEYAETFEAVEAMLDDEAGEDEDGWGTREVPQEAPEDCIRLMSGLFHPQHSLFVRACEFAFEDCCRQGRAAVAAEYGNICLNAYRKYGGHCWRNVGLYEYKLGGVLLGMAREAAGARAKEEEAEEVVEEAEEHLSCAVGVLARTHGKEHPMVRKVEGMLAQVRAMRTK